MGKSTVPRGVTWKEKCKKCGHLDYFEYCRICKPNLYDSSKQTGVSLEKKNDK